MHFTILRGVHISMFYSTILNTYSIALVTSDEKTNVINLEETDAHKMAINLNMKSTFEYDKVCN